MTHVFIHRASTPRTTADGNRKRRFPHPLIAGVVLWLTMLPFARPQSPGMLTLAQHQVMGVSIFRPHRVTLVLGLRFPDVFTRLAVLSPSIWWDDCALYGLVETVRHKPALKIWLDTGTAEPGWERAAVLRDSLIDKGWELGQDLAYLEAEGADHHEGAWAYRMESVLTFLFPPH